LWGALPGSGLAHQAKIQTFFVRLTETPLQGTQLNPVENVWQYLRQTYLSNRVFDSDDAINDAACEAWNRLIDKRWMLMWIGMREWAYAGQSQ
jgi:hypothetical protein